MKPLPIRLATPLALVALLFAGAGLFLSTSAAQAQCLEQSECDALKEQMRELRGEAKADRQELRDLKRQIRALPRGSAERTALKQQIRSLRKELKERRRAARPLLESFRQGCKNC